jgi:hypothetical protein
MTTDKDRKTESYPGPIRAGFKRVRLNVPIHWCDTGSKLSPCGSANGNDITTDKYHEDVTCSECLRAIAAVKGTGERGKK